ncbi:MAG: hypothetical protein IPG43_04935 [Proteobacteria bacterium]|nr:hypothetical protein [Pseudomonadota bacterium]
MMAQLRRSGPCAALALLLTACGAAPEQTLSEFASPDGDYLLRVTLVAGAGRDGAHQVHLYLVPRGMAAGAPAVSTELANDGAPFSGKQIGLTWLAQRTVLMCLKPRGAAPQRARGVRPAPGRRRIEVLKRSLRPRAVTANHGGGNAGP